MIRSDSGYLDARYLAVTFGLRAVLLMASVLFLAKSFGPKLFGEIAIVGATGTILSGIASVGVPMLLLREAGRRSERFPELAAQGIQLASFAGLLLTGLCLIFLSSFAKLNLGPMAIVLLLTSDLLFFNVVECALRAAQGMQNRNWFIFLSLLPASSRATISGFVYFLSLGSDRYAILISIASLLGALLSLCATMRRPISRLSTTSAKSILLTGLPYAVSTLTYRASTEIDKPLLGLIRSAQEAGFYAPGSRISDVARILMSSVTEAGLPKFIALHEAMPSELSNEARRQVFLNFLIAIGYAVAAPLAGLALQHLLGHGYDGITSVAIWSCIPLFAYGPRIVLRNLLLAANNAKSVISSEMQSLVITIILVSILAHLYGWKGSLLGVAAGEIMTCILFLRAMQIRQRFALK